MLPQYPSQTHNCARPPMVYTMTTHSSYTMQLSKLPKLTKVRSHGNNVCDVNIEHIISADAQRYRCGKRKVILGPAGHVQSARLAGKMHCEQ